VAVGKSMLQQVLLWSVSACA